VVGVPEITPLLDRLSPGGNADPAAATQLHVNGVSPPEAVRENPFPIPPYPAPSVPSGGAPDVIVSGGGGAMTIGYGVLTCAGGEAESVTVTITV